MLYYIRKGREGLIYRLSFPGDIPFKKFFRKFWKPLDNGGKMCYTISVNRRGADHLPLKLLLKVCALSPVVSFPIGPSRRVCLLIFTSFLWRRVGGAPDCWMVFIVIFFLTTGIDLWRRGKRTHTLVGETTPWLWKRHWRLGNRRAADIVDWDNRSPSVFETGSVGAAPTSTARLIFENRNVIILRGSSIG